MEAKPALLAVAIFSAFAVPALAAGQQTAAGPVPTEGAKAERAGQIIPEEKDGSAGEKDYKPAFELEDLFGCKPMGEEGPMHGPASGVGQHGTMRHR